jgi:type IV secretory pathway VirB4 component
MIYIYSEKSTLEGQQSSLFNYRIAEGEDQENLKENKANKETEDENTAISDIDEANLVEDTDTGLTTESALGLESTAPLELLSQDRLQDATIIVLDTEQLSDDKDSLPPLVTSLGERSQKRSSGRMTVPSSRLQGYKLY